MATKWKDCTLECGICCEKFDQGDHHPRVLPCLHTYCFSCLQRTVQDKRLTCQYCKSTHDFKELSEFPKDNTRRDLINFMSATSQEKNITCEMCDENEEATHRCKECGYFICSYCVHMHKRVKLMKEHKLVPLENLSNATIQELEHFHHQMFCSEKGHEQDVIRMYCLSCQKSICALCALSLHKNHTACDISEAFEKESQKVNCVSLEIQRKVLEIDKTVQTVKTEADINQKHATKQRSNLKDVFKNAKSMLEKREEELSREIDCQKERRKELLDNQLEYLTLHKESCMQAQQFLERAIAYKNKPAFLEISSMIFNRMQQLKNTTFSESPVAHSATYQLDLARVGLDFQNRVDSLGKMNSSNIQSEISEVDVRSHSLIGEEVAFHVKLSSTEGSIIDDEKVILKITNTNKEEENLLCEFSTSRKEYFVAWIPKCSGTYTWNIWSNSLAVPDKKGIITIESKNQQEIWNKTDNLLFASIEIGTVSSGYSYTFISNPQNVISYNWRDGHFVYHKTHTSILFGKDGEFLRFGFEAEDAYADLVEQNEHKQHNFYQGFTSEIYSQNVTTDVIIKGENDIGVELSVIYTESLRYLRNHLLETLKLSTKTMIYDTDIIWIIPYPSFTSETTKTFLQRCAKKVGFKDGTFVFVKESQAILQFCKHYKDQYRDTIENLPIISSDCRYIVLHLGGSNSYSCVCRMRSNSPKDVDFVECRVIENGCVADLDRKMHSILEEVAGESVLKKFKTENKSTYLEMLRNFEISKQKIGNKGKDRKGVPIPSDFINCFEESSGKRFEKETKTNMKGKLVWEGKICKINNKALKDTFERIVENIVDHVRTTVDLHNVNTIIMAGGFSSSSLLQSKIKNSFPNFRIVIPSSPVVSTMTGALQSM